MAKDLTNSRLDRQNILNNEIAVEEIQKKSGIEGILWEDKIFVTRDMALRDAFHYQLSEYIQPLDRDEYQKFLGAAGDELDKLMEENREVLRRLKERD